MGWTQQEAKAAVTAYFRLLDQQEAGEKTNKAAIYRELAARHPARSAKAFERKFQNISAILFEHRLPFCDGLLPNWNYQNLLKLLVLDHLERSPRPAVEPHQVLFRELSRLKKRGPIKVRKKGHGRLGLTIEGALGIPANSSKSADFMGIELKTKAGKTLQTLFSRTPCEWIDGSSKSEFFDQHCYHDAERDREALYTSFGANKNTLGFRLTADQESITASRHGNPVFRYRAEAIESALLSKHMQTAFIAVSEVQVQGEPHCRINSARFCKWPSIIRFLRLVNGGAVHLDLTMWRRGKSIRDHGFLWRIDPRRVDDLYLVTETL